MNRSLGWGRGLALLGLLTVLVYLYFALFLPGTLTYSPFIIQDDARQFGTWWPQTIDPNLLRGDRMANYWRAMSPWGYRLPFSVAGDLGIDPLLFARLLPVPLIAVSLWAAWHLALKLCPDRRVAFFAAAFCFGYLIHDDSLFGATPRSFSHPLLLLALNAIAGRRFWLAGVWLAVLSSFYPTTAIAGLGILGLAQVRLGTVLQLVLPRRAILPLTVVGAVVMMAALPLQQRAEPWGPVITLEQALEMPNMNRMEGRSSIVDESGHIAWVCSSRMGFLPEALPCRWNTWAIAPINALLLLPLVLLAIGAAQNRPDPETADRNRLYLHALVTCTVCFGLAALVAFRLHFPGRYTQRILGPLEWLAIGQMLGGWLVTHAQRWRIGAFVLLTVVAATPLPGFVYPADPGLIRFIQRLPANARIAGVSEELAVVPALTGRAITAAPEQAIPWHMGYYRPYERDLKLSLEAVSTPDPARVIEAAHGAQFLMADRSLLERSQVPKRYGQIVPDADAAARLALASGRSAVQRGAERCAVYRGQTAWLLDIACLGRPGPGAQAAQPKMGAS